MTIDGDLYAGTVSRGVSSAFMSGFARGKPVFGNAIMISDQFQGLLTNKQGKVLRCAIQSAGGRGHGLCQDNSGRNFDVLIGGDDPRGTFSK